MYAWSTIELGPNIETNDNLLTFISGNEIVIDGENWNDYTNIILAGDIDLIIDDPIPC